MHTSGYRRLPVPHAMLQLHVCSGFIRTLGSLNLPLKIALHIKAETCLLLGRIQALPGFPQDPVQPPHQSAFKHTLKGAATQTRLYVTHRLHLSKSGFLLDPLSTPSPGERQWGAKSLEQKSNGPLRDSNRGLVTTAHKIIALHSDCSSPQPNLGEMPGTQL